MPKSAMRAAYDLYAAAVDFTAKSDLHYSDIHVEVQSSGAKSLSGAVSLVPTSRLSPSVHVTALLFSGSRWEVRADYRLPQEHTARGWAWIQMEDKPSEKVKPIAIPREGRRGEFDYRVHVATWEEGSQGVGKEKLTIFDPWAPPSRLWILVATQSMREATSIKEIIKILRTGLYERSVSNDERMQLIGHAQMRLKHPALENARRAPEFGMQNQEILSIIADQYGWRGGGG
jgi:hypothetical protein